MSEGNQVATQQKSAPAQYNPGDVFLNTGAFNMTYKAAQMLASSTMVPEVLFQNNVSNCFLALNLANRVGIDVFALMPKLYMVYGKPAMESQIQIALLQASGRFTPLKYIYSGKVNTDDWSCYAEATEIETGDKVKGPTVSISMAKKEGWYDKNGSKWKTLPELMLSYRSASFFINIHDPGCRMGLVTREEAQDAGVKAVEVEITETPLEAREKEYFTMSVKTLRDAETVDALDKIKNALDKEAAGNYWERLDQEYIACLEDLSQPEEKPAQKEQGGINTNVAGAEDFPDQE